MNRSRFKQTRYTLVLLLALAACSPEHVPAQSNARFVAIDNVCAWPNLTLMNDGGLTATIYNRPSHGNVDGFVETWMSTDGGRLWQRQGAAAPHEPRASRHNVAAGAAHDGTLVVLISGTDLNSPRSKDGAYTDWKWLPLMVSRSYDKGRTWERSTASVEYPDGVDYLIPFGDIIPLPDGRLAAPCYIEHRYSRIPATRSRAGTKRTGSSYLLFSEDDGRSWGDAVVIAPDDYNETAVLRLRPGRWLAAVRTYKDAHLDLFVSEDEGSTWTNAGPLTLPSHHPAHLLQLADGRILLTYGIRERNNQGVGIRWSENEGRTWKAPTMLVRLEGTTDGGYPATVQLADGTLVTTYYSNGIPEHRRYHMGVLRWNIPE